MGHGCFTLLCWFCYTTKWISHVWTYTLALSDLPCVPLPTPRSPQSTELSSLHRAAGSHQLSHTWRCTQANTCLPIHHLPPTHTCPHICVLCLHLFSCPVSRFICIICQQRMRWLMASRTLWRWVWVNSRSWWRTGRPGELRFMGLQRVGHDWAAELNWTDVLKCEIVFSSWLTSLCITESRSIHISTNDPLWSLLFLSNSPSLLWSQHYLIYNITTPTF